MSWSVWLCVSVVCSGVGRVLKRGLLVVIIVCIVLIWFWWLL